MTSYYIDKWFWAMFEQTDSQLHLILLINFSCELEQIMTRYDLLGKTFELGQIGGSFKKKVQSGVTNLSRFYIALNWGEKWFLSSKSELCRYSM